MNNTKTPVMILQELAVGRSWVLPEYSIIHAQEGTHDNVFHYQVVLRGEVAIGIGRSKKEAKHKAASMLLEKFSDIVDSRIPQSCVPEKKLKLVNAVGNLGDICIENKIPHPIFTQISDVGPPHCREFTYECKVAALVTRATASTKKQAKHWAAKEMTDRIMNALPELINEDDDEKFASMAIDDKVKEEYTHIKLAKSKPNLSLEIGDRNMHLKNIANEKGVDSNFIETHTSVPSKENLEILLEKMELNYDIQLMPDTLGENRVCIVTLIIDTDVPFSFLGIGHNYESAVEDVLITTFDNFRVMLT